MTYFQLFITTKISRSHDHLRNRLATTKITVSVVALVCVSQIVWMAAYAVELFANRNVVSFFLFLGRALSYWMFSMVAYQWLRIVAISRSLRDGDSSTCDSSISQCYAATSIVDSLYIHFIIECLPDRTMVSPFLSLLHHFILHKNSSQSPRGSKCQSERAPRGSKCHAIASRTASRLRQRAPHRPSSDAVSGGAAPTPTARRRHREFCR